MSFVRFYCHLVKIIMIVNEVMQGSLWHEATISSVIWTIQGKTLPSLFRHFSPKAIARYTTALISCARPAHVAEYGPRAPGPSPSAAKQWKAVLSRMLILRVQTLSVLDSH